MRVRVKKLHSEACIPRYANPQDSGFDLVATEDVIIAPGETALVPTGLAFEIPDGYELQIRPRSGVSLRTKLRVANTPGTVDSSYRGEVKVIIDNIAQLDELSYYWTFIDATIQPIDNGAQECPYGTYLIRAGDRIAQGVIAPVVRANLEETDGELADTERGSGGFGHTGVSA
ncbi:dUTP diphosphatase [Paenibacillus sp. PDC88]|uniref:dUTP diphosphatase n=1 Tax=Paenibacillus sp. PDC88 TaxID=1884375 RepID=UPI00089497C5|nr:dUTP diphosphatase [Paenibacillus sp. PDC88]SDW23491.1 dUTP pyrophosphatase [Paenibacillus sp. PDC88]